MIDDNKHMSNHYFSTFITGFDEFIKEELNKNLVDLKIEMLLDGLVVYETNDSRDKVRQLPFFNNTFLLLDAYEGNDHKDIEGMIAHMLPRLNESLPDIKIPKRQKTFKIIVSHKNQFTSVNSKLLANIEKSIKENTRLLVDKGRADVEFWFLLRSEGIGLFGMRLTRLNHDSDTLEKGALRPELACILNVLSEPKNNDVFLDPFAGIGSIPISRSQLFPYKKIIASDNDADQVLLLEDRITDQELSIEVNRWDGLKLSKLADNSINKIVTDPPWGYFEQKSFDPANFYSRMLNSFYRVLSSNGLAVILVGEREIFETVLQKTNEKFRLLKKHHILVSGKKAGVYKLQKTCA